MPRFRFRLREMMVVVAISAMAFAAIKLRERRNGFLLLAEANRREAEATWRIFETMPTGEPPHFANLRRTAEIARYYEKLTANYENAARMPWIDPGPKPPYPD